MSARLTVLVNPRVGTIDERALLDAVVAAMSPGTLATVGVERSEPLMTMGKQYGLVKRSRFARPQPRPSS